jgi:hypothetical protein
MRAIENLDPSCANCDLVMLLLRVGTHATLAVLKQFC